MKKNNYMDGKKLTQMMQVYHETVLEAKKDGKKMPRIPDDVALAIVKISEHLALRPNFIGYSYIDEMIADARENCVKYLHHYNPLKSTNAFAYITQICWYSFIRRINLEKRQTKVKASIIHNMDMNEFLECGDQDDGEEFKNSLIEFLRENYDPSLTVEKKKEKIKNEDDINTSLSSIFDDDYSSEVDKEFDNGLSDIASEFGEDDMGSVDLGDIEDFQ